MITGNEMRNMGNDIMRELMHALGRQCHDGGSVNQACKDSITQIGVYRYVYNVYQPTVYGRRYAGGGLADEDNLMTTTSAGRNSVTIDIEDRTPAGDSGMRNPPPDPVFYLSDVIEAGVEGAKWQDPDWPGARPYMEPSLQDGCSTGGRIDNAINAIFQNLILRA